MSSIEKIPRKKQIAVQEIELDGNTQVRRLNPEIVAKYAGLLKDGYDKFPPVEVVQVPTASERPYILWNGFHRVNACLTAGIDMITAMVRQGTAEDARWLAFSANKDCGYPRSPMDLRNILEVILTDPKYQAYSTRDIAKHVGCSHETVRKHRRRLQDDEEAATSPEKPIEAARQGPIVLLDELDNEIPASLERAFNIRGKAAKAANMITDVILYVDNFSDGDEELDKARIKLLARNIQIILKKGMPYTICKACEAYDGYCDVCDGKGWLTQEQWESKQAWKTDNNE